ncbi:MAG: hypothetical protein ACOY0T_09870 [Myxococcota bacterium]
MSRALRTTNAAWRAATLVACLLVHGPASADPPRERAPRPELSAEPQERRREMQERLRDRLEHLRELRAQRRRRDELKAELDRELSKDHPNAEALKRKLEAFAQTRDERRRERRTILSHRWGASAERAEVREELVRHARTQARLERLRLVAATERSGVRRQRLLERIERLSKLESQRHERTMQALVPPPSAASAAPPGSAGAP